MKKHLKILAILCFSINCAFSQGSAFGLKGGLTMGTQKWNNFERNALFKYHGALYIESLNPENSNSLFAQIGYHVKGSALRNRNYTDINGNPFQASNTFEFNNLSLIVGAKQKYDLGTNSKYYYSFGLRGDYTLSTNLDENETFSTPCAFFPCDAFVQKAIFGLSIGGGIEWMFTDLAGGFLEFNVHPDITAQYKQPGFSTNSSNPNTPNQISERTIRNLAFEVTLGIRLLRIVEYID